MHLFDMRGAWGRGISRLYDAVVSRGSGDLYRRLAAEVDPWLARGARLLDVGCGPGHAACLLARRRPDLSIVALDLSPAMVARARARAAAVPNVRVQRGDACALPFAAAEFDAAISVASIKHWPDPALGAREMARVVRPGGRVAIAEADPRCSRAAAANFVSGWRFLLPGTRPLALAYFLRFVARQGIDAPTLARLLSRAGLASVSSASLPDLPVAFATGTRPPA